MAAPWHGRAQICADLLVPNAPVDMLIPPREEQPKSHAANKSKQPSEKAKAATWMCVPSTDELVPPIAKNSIILYSLYTNCNPQ